MLTQRGPNANQTYGSVVLDENDVHRSFNYPTEMNMGMKKMKKLAIPPFQTIAVICRIFSRRNDNFSFRDIHQSGQIIETIKNFN